MLASGLRSLSVSFSLCVLLYLRGQAEEAGWPAQSQICLCTGILVVLAEDNSPSTITQFDAEESFSGSDNI